MQLNVNTQLQGGKYRIIRVLGQGGFGITYLAENLLLGRMVAIKEFFPKDFCGRDNTSHLTLGTQNNAETVEKLRARFLKEARNIARLDHPGIVKIHDVFEENNTAYYVMDFIDGENLNEMVRREGPLSEAKAIDYIRKVGDALDYIHSRNMTHFDVKPANIMVRRTDNQPVLVDFGLSKQYDRQGGATSTLMPAVSQGYSPIELYNPATLTSFSPQTDIYSLGATLYFLVTGKVPPEVTLLISGREKFIFPTAISPRLISAIEQATKIVSTERFKTIKAFILIVESVKGSSNAKTVPTDVSPSALNEETVLVTSDSKPKIHEFRRIYSWNIYEDKDFHVKWKVTGADTITIDGIPINENIGVRKFNAGSKPGKRTFILIAANQHGTSRQGFEIDVLPSPEPQIKDFKIINEDPFFYVGDVVKVQLNVEYANEVLLNGVQVDPVGVYDFDVKANGTFPIKLTAKNKRHSITKSISFSASTLKPGNLLIRKRISKNDPNREIKGAARELGDSFEDMPKWISAICLIIFFIAFFYITILIIDNIIGLIPGIIIGYLGSALLYYGLIVGMIARIRKNKWIKEHPNDPRIPFLE